MPIGIHSDKELPAYAFSFQLRAEVLIMTALCKAGL